jgi:hypothetical protein
MPSAAGRRSVDLIILSSDHALLSVIQSVADSELLLWPAATAEAVVEHLVAGRCGILLVDLVHLRGEVVVLLTRLAEQFPNVVLMVAGRREEESTVTQLVTQGVVYRFIHKPISPGRAQQFLSAALRRYRQLNEREPFGLATVRELVQTTLWQQLFRYSLWTAGCIGAIGVAGFLLSNGLENPQPQPEAVLQVSPPPRKPAADAAPHESPSLASSVQQPVAPSSSFDEQLEEMRRMVEAGRLNDAMRAVRAAATARPDDARVSIIATSIGEQLLTRASAALAEGNLELAQRRLNAARALDADLRLQLPDLQAGIDALEHARKAAEANELEALLVVARARRESGELVEPAGASAFDQLQLARTRSPNDASVGAETQALALACIEAAEDAIAEQRFDLATTLLDHADQLVPAMNATRTLRMQISLMREPLTWPDETPP